MKFILLFLLIINVSYASYDTDRGECLDAFGSAYPLSPDKIRMIEELQEAIKGIESPAGSYAKKVAFFQDILPDVVAALDQIEEERKEMLSLLKKENQTPEDNEKLQNLKNKYNAESDAELVERINIVPMDLILVQSALETGWGSSVAAKQCQNMVGLHALGGLSVCDTPSKKIASFASRKDSFSAYLLSLNRNDKYKDFRKKRSELLENQGRFTGVELAPHLLSYSTRKQHYVDEVRQFIKSHKLDDIFVSALELADGSELPDNID